MLETKIKKILKYLNTGDYKRVINDTIKLSKKNPTNSYLKNLLGFAYLEIKDLMNAKKNFLGSIKLNPNNIAAINNLANVFKYLHYYEDAEQFYKRALAIDPNYINALNNYGNLKFNNNEPNESIILYKKALSADSSNYIASYNLALIYQSIGNFDECKKYAKKVLEIEPKFTRADKLLSTYTKYRKDDKHLLKMINKVSNKNTNKEYAVYLHFALAKAFNDIGSFDDSIFHLKSGNSLKASLVNYNIDQDIDLFASIKSTFNNLDFNSIKIKNNTSKFIFVVGMPRSGTSLVEQILSSHDKVFGAGELPFLKSSIFENFDNSYSRLGSILKKSSTLNAIAQSYLKKISTIKSDNKTILDKSLLNFLWIGFIRILFPKAKILHIKRDSKDTCLSCYKTLFDSGLYFTYDKYNLSSFYNHYTKLMNFWEKSLGNHFYTVKYEELIKDQNKNISNILNFCELDFDEKCLNFHKNKSMVKTMSASQVRQKIYSSSVQSYKKYEDKLSDLFENLTVE